MAQSPTTTITLGPNQIGVVKTAERITTRISFPETVKEIICGDLYDPATGRGGFVVQGSNMDVFLKPIASKGISNIFVKTGEKGEFIYSLDLVIVPVSEAYRIVTILNSRDGHLSATPQAQPSGAWRAVPPLPASVSADGMPQDINESVLFGSFINVSDNLVMNEPPSPIRLKSEPNATAHKATESILLHGEPTKRVAATYPEYAKPVKASGPVVVEVIIDERGKVKSAKAISGHFYLREAAVIAALAWRFKPIMVEGETVTATGRIVFNFDQSGRADDGRIGPFALGNSEKLQGKRHTNRN